MRRILKIISMKTDDISSSGLNALIFLVKTVDSAKKKQNSEHSEFLISYIQHQIDEFQFGQEENVKVVKIYNALLDTFNKTFENKEASKIKSLMEIAWFLTEVIFKTIVLDLNQRSLLNKSRKSNIGEDTQKKIVSFFENITRFIEFSVNSPEAAPLNHAAALFAKDLLAVLDRGFVMSIVKKILD